MIAHPEQTIAGILPGGFVDDNGELHQHVTLRSLSGLEEELLANSNGLASAQVTQLLSQTIVQLGKISPITSGVARRLSVVDRQFMLLKLREITFGNQIELTLVCSNCGEKIDVDFSVQDIPVQDSSDKGPLYTMQLASELAYQENGEFHREVVFRLPNGSDQEELESLLPDLEETAGRHLLARCIQRLGTIDQPGLNHIDRLSPDAMVAIEQAIEAATPNINLMMGGACPECDHGFEVPFDIQALLLSELSIQTGQLYREIHYLAFHYHWSETEIMAMSRPKRRHYMAILAEEIKKMNNGH